MLEIIVDRDSKGFTVSDKAQHILRDQTIDEDQPGTILRDFETLLAFVGDEGLKTSSKYYLLPQSKLDELNLLTSHPVTHRLKRPQQRSFPHLHGLYLLLRSSGLAVGVGAPPGGRLMLKQQTVLSWRSLNAAERYFALLESWLVQGSPEVLAERCGWTTGCFQSLTEVAHRLRDRRTVGDYLHGGVLHGTMNLVAVALMEMFGWLRLEYGQPAAGEGVKIAAVERLALGDAMVNTLNASYLTCPWSTHHDDRPAQPGVLQPLFQSYFPEYQRTLAQQELPFRDGTYTWRVSLSRAWRRIVAPANLSLDDLAMTILDAVGFDDDHLYCFELRQANGRTMRIACPHENDAACFTDEVALGDLPLSEGGTMTMVFDYGDSWHFNIKLEKIGPPDAKPAGPRVTAQGGDPPAQYTWDDEE